MPDDLPDEQVACFFVNPATVLVMIENVLQVPRGAWLIQTAAASALGKMIVKFGKHAGFRTLNIVRRAESAAELRQLGADAVVDTTLEKLEERVPAIVGTEGVRFGVDAVGGGLAGHVLDLLAPGGRLLNYGVLAGEPIRVPPRASSWAVGGSRASGSPIGRGARIRSRCGGSFAGSGRSCGPACSRRTSASPFRLLMCRAVAHAQQPGRQGKTLLKIGSA